jgi:SAM-dependent methyltransferase
VPGPVTSCRACGGRFAVTMADLGLQPPSNAFLSSLADAAHEKRYPLRAVVCESCKLVQVDYDVAPEELFGNYVYFSSYSDDWLAHAKAYCAMAQRRFGLGASSLVVELASNDGYLLKNFLQAGVPVLGIDPSDTVAAAAEQIGVPTLVEFFGETVAARLASQGKQADLIIGNNVLAHVPRLNDFVAGIAALLKPAGSVTIEFPHLLTLIEQVAFDTIYHEHYSYISLFAIEQVFGRHGLRLYDVEQLSTHGGSLRIFASHASRELSDSDALRRVRALESSAGLGTLDAYRRRCCHSLPRPGGRANGWPLTAPLPRAIPC